MDNIAVVVLRAVAFTAGGALWSLLCLLVALLGSVYLLHDVVKLPVFVYVRRYDVAEGVYRAARATYDADTRDWRAIIRSALLLLGFPLIGIIGISFASLNPIAALPIFDQPAGDLNSFDLVAGIVVGVIAGIVGIWYAGYAATAPDYTVSPAFPQLKWPTGTVTVIERAYAGINVFAYVVIKPIAAAVAPLAFLMSTASLSSGESERPVEAGSSSITLRDATLLVAVPMAYIGLSSALVWWSRSRLSTAGALALLQQVLNPIPGRQGAPSLLRLPPDPLWTARGPLNRASRSLRRLARRASRTRKDGPNVAMATILMESSIVLDGFLVSRRSLREDLPDEIEDLLNNLSIILTGPFDAETYGELSDLLSKLDPEAAEKARAEMASSRLRLVIRELPSAVERSSKVVTSAAIIFVILTLAVLAVLDQISLNDLLEKLP